MLRGPYIEAFFCKRGDWNIAGTAFLPKNRAGMLSAVIIAHEFMANQLFSFPYAQALSQTGYAVFCFDFCGGGVVSASGGKSVDMSVLTEMEDLNAVLSYVKARDDVDGNKIALMGCSQGGFVSALVTAERAGEIRSLVLLYPAFSIPEDAQNGHMVRASFDPNNIPDTFWSSIMELGRRYAADVMEMDAFELIQGYYGNVLLVHGDADQLVNVRYSQQALASYRRAGARASLVTIPEAGHIFVHRAHREIAIRHISAFLRDSEK